MPRGYCGNRVCKNRTYLIIYYFERENGNLEFECIVNGSKQWHSLFCEQRIYFLHINFVLGGANFVEMGGVCVAPAH